VVVAWTEPLGTRNPNTSVYYDLRKFKLKTATMSFIIEHWTLHMC